MTLNYELCQSGFSVLSHRPIVRLSKICFLCTYVDQMKIQKRFDVCFNFNFTTFSLIFFPLFSKFFTNIVKIYKLPKIYNKIPMPQMHQAFKLYPSYLYWICTLKTLLALNLKKKQGRTFFKNTVPKESFFVVSDIAPYFLQ